MPIDAAAAKFLYAIIKQVDVRKIDWQIVASDQGIPTANAARMRFTRLKAQMDGDTTTAAKSEPAVPRKRKEKDEKAEESKTKRRRQKKDETDADVANSSDVGTAIHGTKSSKPRAETQGKDKPTVRATSSAKTQPIVKYEPVDFMMDELPLSTIQESSNLPTELSSPAARVQAKREYEQTDFAEDLA
ncbi:MAG: hypothetical protein LQ341_005055 [Variospora aurantia]|nr:MAG: hypothetical protein LQ341_005055 [Variospora aurantia]